MTSIFTTHDTICAPATAQGGAIAVVRISGPRAIEIADAIFSRPIADAPGYSLLYGTIGTLDDVMLSVFRGPKSYTGEDAVEIACHGSSYIVAELLRLLQEQGSRMAEPGEFTRRAFLNGRMDLAQAEAVADLIASTNAAAHRLAMSQMRGGFTRALAQMRAELLRLTSLLELELDFSDHEDLEFADRSELSALTTRVLNHVTTLADSFRAGNALKNGIPVAIIGAPNVGKSTLLNALVHEDRAIVSDIEGTTRDVIEAPITIAGHTFRFIDTAGLRSTTDVIERMGIERSMEAARRAQIVLLLADATAPVFPEYKADDHQCVIRIANKSDLASSTLPPGAIALSAKTLSGLDSLHKTLAEAATRLTATESDLIITNARHHASLLAARTALIRVSDALDMGLSGDLIAQDLHEALHHLAAITGGAITSDEVLSDIFQHFCIGK